MQNKKINIHSFIPHISNRALLFVAFLVWTFAGGMLIYRGIIGIVEFPAFIVIKLIVALLLGTAFYWFMFTKISNKYVTRIINMQEEKVPFYAFFNLRGYIMMTLMIGLGITMRKTGLVPFEYLTVFYVTMGIPLLVSSFKFLYKGIVFNKN